MAKADLADYNKDIQITYWSQIGGWDINSTDERARSGRQYTASAQELLDAGFQLLNYNAYYTYFLPGQRMWQPESYTYTINDLVANWDLSKFELNSGKQVNSTENVIGSALTFGVKKLEIIQIVKSNKNAKFCASLFKKNEQRCKNK